MKESNLLIQVEHFSKNYADFAAVRELSFSVGPGEIVGLVGANGARCVAVLLPPATELDATGS